MFIYFLDNNLNLYFSLAILVLLFFFYVCLHLTGKEIKGVIGQALEALRIGTIFWSAGFLYVIFIKTIGISLGTQGDCVIFNLLIIAGLLLYILSAFKFISLKK